MLEARDRVGGRALNADIGGGEITERGGTFVGPTQDRIARARREDRASAPSRPTTPATTSTSPTRQRLRYSDTGADRHRRRRTSRSSPTSRSSSPTSTRRSKKVPVDAPWEAADAAALDDQTLAAYIEQNSPSPAFRELIPIATRPIFGAEPTELSLLYVLFYIASSGNEQNVGTFERNFNTRDGAQDVAASSAARS